MVAASSRCGCDDGGLGSKRERQADRALVAAYDEARLADTGADTAVIRELAGHADIRTATIHTRRQGVGTTKAKTNS